MYIVVTTYYQKGNVGVVTIGNVSISRQPMVTQNTETDVSATQQTPEDRVLSPINTQITSVNPNVVNSGTRPTTQTSTNTSTIVTRPSGGPLPIAVTPEPPSMRDLSALAPKFKQKVEELLRLIPDAKVTESYRTPERSDFLYGIGRKYILTDGRGSGGKTVTNAVGGASWHNYGTLS